MKKISMLPALASVGVIVLASRGAGAESASDLPRAPFPAMVTTLDFDMAGDKYGCQLSTASEGDKIRIRWIPKETSIERMSVTNDKVTARVKVPVTKLVDQDGIAVYGYREANVIVLFVPQNDTFATVTANGDRMFMAQNCGIGMTLLFTQPPSGEEFTGCEPQKPIHLPGFCGRLARIDGTLNPETGFSVSAGLSTDQKVRVIVKTRPTKAP